MQGPVPRRTGGRGEIAVDPPNRRFTETGDLLEQALDNPGLGVVRIDEDGESLGRLFRFYPDDCFWLHDEPIDFEYSQSIDGAAPRDLRLIPRR